MNCIEHEGQGKQQRPNYRKMWVVVAMACMMVCGLFCFSGCSESGNSASQGSQGIQVVPITEEDTNTSSDSSAGELEQPVEEQTDVSSDSSTVKPEETDTSSETTPSDEQILAEDETQEKSADEMLEGWWMYAFATDAPTYLHIVDGVCYDYYYDMLEGTVSFMGTYPVKSEPFDDFSEGAHSGPGYYLLFGDEATTGYYIFDNEPDALFNESGAHSGASPEYVKSTDIPDIVLETAESSG